MTTNDTVTIPRELAERIYGDMAFGAAANELAAILNPPDYVAAVKKMILAGREATRKARNV